jgi:hypothetical protein
VSDVLRLSRAGGRTARTYPAVSLEPDAQFHDHRSPPSLPFIPPRADLADPHQAVLRSCALANSKIVSPTQG